MDVHEIIGIIHEAFEKGDVETCFRHAVHVVLANRSIDSSVHDDLSRVALLGLIKAKTPEVAALGVSTLDLLCRGRPLSLDSEEFDDIVDGCCTADSQFRPGAVAALALCSALFRADESSVRAVVNDVAAPGCVRRLCSAAMVCSPLDLPLVCTVVGQVAAVSYQPAIVFTVCSQLASVPVPQQRAFLQACPQEEWTLAVADTLLSTSHMFRISDPAAQTAFRVSPPSFAKVERYLFFLRPVPDRHDAAATADALGWLVWLTSFVLRLLTVVRGRSSASPDIRMAAGVYVSSLSKWCTTEGGCVVPREASLLLPLIPEILPLF